VSARATPLSLPGGHYAVPGNRWDLLDAITPTPAPSVSVIVAYYDGQERLDRMMAALAAQTHPLDRLEVIVADDGSPTPPVIRANPGLRVQLVRQDDRGFRAAAARNLGAASARGDVLCFLDDDTLPEPGYLTALTRLPAMAPDAIVTGRRRHADLSGLDEAHVAAWLRGAARPPERELPEPEWLRAEHRRSANLLRIGPDSHRYVISAVLACSRVLFDAVGGFDPRFTRYGGEDWEFAHRALCAGAVLAHEPAAVAWHDGPSWAERGDPDSRRRQKNAETAALLGLIPPARGRGLAWTGRPDVVVEINTDGEDEAAVIVAVGSILAGDVDAGVWVAGEPGRAAVEHCFANDARVHAGAVGDEAGASARVSVTCSRPLRVATAAWAALMDALGGEDGGPGRIVVDTADGKLVVTLNAAQSRARRWASTAPSVELVDELFGRVDLDAAAVGVTPVAREPDLAHEIKHLHDPS
jgi:GT2 family glycosyltransferase